VEGRVASGGRATPLGVLVDLLQRALGVEETDPEGVIVDKLERRALRFGEGIRPVLPFLRYLLSIDPGDPAVAAMDPTLRRAAIFDALRRVLFRAAERRPQVLVVEDVHWIDQASEEWLRLVADGMAARRVLLVLTSRPGAAPAVPERTFHTRLALPALSGSDSAQMACALLAVEELPAPLQRLLVAKAEGNPFFLEELVRALQEVGAVRRAGDGLVVAGDVDGIAVPDTVQDVILSRIERLSPEPAAILEVAAVIGKDVPFDVLAAVAGRPEEVLRAGLRELQAAEFLYETSLYPEWAHTFKHALTHDVAYGRVLPDRRRALHAAIVGAIERLHAGRLGDQAERLAAHARGGEVWGKALVYARQAGARAMARSANPEAVAFYEQALGALERLPETPETAEQAIDARFELRSALIPLGEVARILRCLREAEALAAARGDRRRLGWGSAYMTISYLLHAEHGRARETGERAVRLADEVGDAALAVVARAYWGHVFRELGDHHRALALFGEVLARLPGEQARERFGQAVQPAVYALSLGALSCSALGDIAGAVRMADEGFRISEAADRPFGLVLASLARAQILTVRRSADEARALAERALVMIEARRLPLWRPWALAVLGWAHALGGRPAEAAPLLGQALNLGARLPFLFGHSLWGIWLGLAHVLAGRPDDAAREGVRGLDLTRQRGERGYEAWAHYLLGEAASRRPEPDLEAARRAYEAALVQATGLGMRPLAAHCRHALARVLEQAGHSGEAAALRAAASEAYRTLDLRAWPVPAGPASA
jgi:tetratricopeptide (TPR) repeat protein